MVIANVLNIYTTALGLWQYDYGQILRIQGLTLPTAVEIHFSLSERGGQAVTRVGTTKDGVTDVVIPDSMLENDGTTMDYKIYAFIYLADSESGQTEYKISMSVKTRPKPESFEKPEDAELFRQAITEVNNSAEVALQSKKEAAAWAHGHEDYPDRDQDNAKYYARQAKDEAEKIQGFDDHVASKKEEATDEIAKARKNAVNAVVAQGTKTAKELEDVKNVASGYVGDAQRYANNASSAASAAETHANNASSAASAAQSYASNASSAASAAQSYASNADTSSKSAATSASKATTALADIKTAQEDINNTKTKNDETAKKIEANKSSVENTKKEIDQLKEQIKTNTDQALTDITTAKEAVVKNVSDTGAEQVNAVNTEGEKQVQAVKDAMPNELNKKVDKSITMTLQSIQRNICTIHKKQKKL